MKNTMRLYTTFIPTRVLPWVMLLIYPAIAVLMSISIGGGYLATEFLMIPVVYILENLFSLVMFREFESKEPVRFEYIHSSERGMRLFSNVIKVDAARRFIIVVLVFMLPVLLYNGLHMGGAAGITLEIDGEEAISVISPMCNMLLSFAMLSVLELMGYIIKRIRSAAVMLLVLFVGYGIMMAAGMMLFGIPEKLLPAAAAVSGFVYLLIVVFGYKAVMKHENEKFYDGMGERGL